MERDLNDSNADSNESLSSLPSLDAGRRTFLKGTAAVSLGVAAASVGAVLLDGSDAAAAQAADSGPSLAASPPAGFTPFSAPGSIVKVSKANSLAANKMYPKPEDAKEMLTRSLTELTGKPDLVTAVMQFVHPQDKVVVKVNGIALRKMGTNAELVIPFLQAMIDGGIPAGNITVLEQYGSFLDGTRVSQANVPAGVKINVHANGDATMAERLIPGTGVRTKFVRALTEATAAINFSLVKDHGICGYTGCLKNMTHGCQIYPHYFHTHHASPQIAQLYAQDVIKSRVRLNIIDAYKVMANGGPLYKQPEHVYPYEAVFATTDPVAMDAIGWDIVEKMRADHGMKTLASEGREPLYIKAAADLGLGVFDRAQIHVKEVTI